MVRLTPRYCKTNIHAYTLRELVRIHGWINTVWILIWKLTGKNLPESTGHLVPTYWEQMKCAPDELSAEAHAALAPYIAAAHRLNQTWQTFYYRRPWKDPVVSDHGGVILFSPGANFHIQAAYSRATSSSGGAIAYATSFLKCQSVVITTDNPAILPTRPGSRVHLANGGAHQLIKEHQRVIAGRRDIRPCETFNQWIETYDHHTELQSQWELDRKIWIPELSQ